MHTHRNRLKETWEDSDLHEPMGHFSKGIAEEKQPSLKPHCGLPNVFASIRSHTPCIPPVNAQTPDALLHRQVLRLFVSTDEREGDSNTLVLLPTRRPAIRQHQFWLSRRTHRTTLRRKPSLTFRAQIIPPYPEQSAQ